MELVKYVVVLALSVVLLIAALGFVRIGWQAFWG
jgi:hypothetical protein